MDRTSNRSRQARFLIALLFAVMASFAWVARSGAQIEAGKLPSLNPMLERVTPGVVNISVSGTIRQQNPLAMDPQFRRFFGLPEEPPERRFESAGSGVIIDAGEGLIITNHHVIQHAEEIYVTLKDRRRLEAEVVGSDAPTDIALLRVEANDLQAVPMGDSDALRVGDFVVAIGNPFALGQTATIGIVSATGRAGIGGGGYQDFIQTDASINPGNSGGALVNQSGELVGINTAILSQSGGNIGIGFAVPINMARQVVEEIREHGVVRRGRLGVFIQDLTPDLAQAMGFEERDGALVTRVLPDTPAEEAGLEAGDLIVAVNSEPVESSRRLRNLIGAMDPGDTVTIAYIRAGERRTARARLASQESTATTPGSAEEGADSPLRGVSLAPVPENHPLHGEVEGVLAARVAPSSPAAGAGLRPGDVIVRVNGTPVSTPEQVKELAREGMAGDAGQLLLYVRRGPGGTFIVIR